MTTVEQIEHAALVLPKRTRLQLATKPLSRVPVDCGMYESEESVLQVTEERAD